MGFSNTKQIENEIRWKFNPKKIKEKDLPLFFNQKVTKKGNIYSFDFLDMEYDIEYNELTVKSEYVELNGKMNLKNKDARESFERLNDSDYKSNLIFKEFRTYFRKIKKENMSITDKIKELVDIKKVTRSDNDLIQALIDLFLEAGLKRTHNRYVMPLTNNICRTIDTDEMLEFIYDVCDIRVLSTETLNIVLTYFNKETKPSYHKIVTKNGFYDFKTHTFHTESNEELIINKASPYSYDEKLIGKEKMPPKLKQFFYETFKDDPSKIEQVLEIFGYYLDDGNPYQLLISFIGPSRSGKSVCVKLESELLGTNHSTVDVFSIDFNSKYAQDLIDSDFNVIEEVRSVRNIAEVKNYTGQGGLQIARIYESPRHYTDLEVPKTLITTNNFKDLENKLDSALIERLRCYVEFCNPIKDSSKRNPQIDKDLIEEPGAMDWLLTNSIYTYSTMLKENRKFKAEKTIEEFSDMLEQYSHPERHIIRTNFKFDMDQWEDNALKEDNYKYFVTIEDVRTAIYLEKPEARISNNTKIKTLIMDTFELVERRYNIDDGDEDFYEIVQKYDKDGKHTIKVIKGLVRC